ncbi:MAG: lysine--tRNA ligase [Candidatus Woesearchaeota archaeon]
MEEENVLIQERHIKLNKLIELGINPYPYKYNRTHTSDEILKKFAKLANEEKSGEQVSVAGRIVQLRRMGKATFAHIQDGKGKVQAYFREDDIKEKYDLLKYLDIGDIIGCNGGVFKTRLGEVTVYVKNLELLTKTLRPLPEKFHGLKDPELRYRMRYVDLIMNPEVKEIFVKRAKIISAIREYLDNKEFVEVDTPCLQTIYGGAHAKPFKTHLNALNMPVYLRISNELYLKRLIVGGFDKVYEFARDFRNEGIDRTHNPEFTQVELYEAYCDFEDMMRMTENIYEYAAKKVLGTTKINFNGHEIDVKAPWKRLTMIEAINKFADLKDIPDISKATEEELKSIVHNYNIEIEGDLTIGTMIQGIFEELCESKLIQPVFITHHPVESTPLCKTLRNGDNKWVERFEPYIAGMEVANGYSELNDPIRQKALLEQQAEQLKGGAEEAHPYDEDFVKAIEYGMPPTGGIGIGIDRMVMVLTGSQSVRDVILFPFMKEMDNGK